MIRKAAGATCDKTEILRTWQAFVPPGSVVELRAIKAKSVDDSYAGTVSGYFDDGQAFADAVSRITQASGIYVTANPVNPALIARSVNKARRVQSEPTTSDADIPRRRWLLIDCDAKRPSGISASDDEHKAALAKAQAVKAQLSAWLWPEPIEADSGNGAHLCYRIDLPADDGGLVNKVLVALSSLFSDEQVKIDTSVHNPARIWKLYGTLACKGDNDVEHGRPHRMAKLLAVPDELQVVPQVLLEELAGDVLDAGHEARKSNHDDRNSGRTADSFNIEAWIQEHGLGVQATHERAGTTFWVLEQCVWNPDHRDKSAFIGRRASGAIVAGCKHDSCSGNGWKELRATVDPAWAEKRERWEQRSKPQSAVLKSGRQNATPIERPEYDPSEAPFEDDYSDNGFLDRQRRGEAKHNSGIGSGFGNDPEEPEPTEDDLPFAPQSVADLLEQNTSLRPAVVEGLFRQAETANFVSASKIGKSHLALELGFSVVTGGKFLGKYACTRGGVLLIDNELHSQTLASRIRRLLVKRQMDVADIKGLEVECLRGRLRDLHAMRQYFDSIEPGRYSLVIIDALYRLLPRGISENDNADVCALYNELDRHAGRIGCAFTLIHHTSKGSQSSKAVVDVGSGAGSQSRAADCHLVLRHHEEQGAVVVDAALRSWPPIEPFCVRWDYPQWSLAEDLDPNSLRPERPPQRKKKSAAEDNVFAEENRPWDTHRFVASFLGPEPILLARLMDVAEGTKGLSGRKADELLKRAVDQGLAFRWKSPRRNEPQRIATVPQPMLVGVEIENE